MTTKTALIDYALAHGCDGDDLAGLEQALALLTEEALGEALALLGGRHCPPVEYCELAARLQDWYRAS